MFDKPRERILAIATILLVGLLVFDRAVLEPVNALLDDWNAEQAELRSQLAKLLPGDRPLGSMEQRVSQASRYIQTSLSERQSQFSRFLEDQIPASVRIEDRSAPPTQTPITNEPDLRKLTYPLVLGGDLNDLRTVLSRLDSSDQPLRINRLHVTLALRVPGDVPSLTAEVRVSTLASAVATPSPTATQPGALVNRQAPPPPPPPTAENMFARDPTATGRPRGVPALDAGGSDSLFTLAGVIDASDGPRAMLNMREPDEIRWLRKGDRVGSAELVAVEPDGAVFQVGDETRTVKVGQGSVILHAGRQTFDKHCTLLAVCESPEQTFAMAEIPGQSEPARLSIGDMLPIGRIKDIRDNALVVDSDGAERIVRIGQNTSSTPSP